LPATPWYRDARKLQAALAGHDGNMRALSDATGVSASTLKTAWAHLGLPPRPRGGAALRAVTAVPDDDSWLLALLKKHKNRADIEQLADEADVPPKRVREALERLERSGYRVAEEDKAVVLHKVPPPSENVHKALFSGEDIAFGVVSDTHLSSKNERLEELHMAYRILEDEGITTVYHPGDLVCGKGIFPGQVNEIKNHTYEDQVDYAVENYPRSKTITTHIIAGNHDIEGEFGKVGANPVVAFCNRRDDFEYAGDYDATFVLPQGTRINLLHPKGSMSYAASYKLQKFAEGFEIGAKPNLMLVGHYHRRLAFEARGIQQLLCACFEAGGTFGRRLGLVDPAVGFHIVRMRVADDGSIVRFLPEWFRFYPGRKVNGRTRAAA
jgi:predicted phosphodiesterase